MHALVQWVFRMIGKPLRDAEIAAEIDRERVKLAAERYQRAGNALRGQLQEIEREYPHPLEELVARLYGRRINTGK